MNRAGKSGLSIVDIELSTSDPRARTEFVTVNVTVRSTTTPLLRTDSSLEIIVFAWVFSDFSKSSSLYEDSRDCVQHLAGFRLPLVGWWVRPPTSFFVCASGEYLSGDSGITRARLAS